MEKKRMDKEVDLLELLAKCYRTIRQNILLTILCPALGIFTGIYMHYIREESVQSSMMIVTDLLSEDECKFLMEQLQKADTIQGLSRSQKSMIAGFSFEVSKDKGRKRDLVEDIDNPYFVSSNVYLQITTVIGKAEVLKVLQDALVNYLNSCEPVVRHRTEKEKFCNAMILKIDAELSALEEVKAQLDNKTKATFLNPSDLFAKSVELYDKKMVYQLALQDVSSVHIVKGFGALTKNAKNSTLLYSLFGLAAGLGVLMIILFIGFFNNYYKQFEKTNP